MMIADTDLGTPSPRPRRSPAGGSLPAFPRGVVFAVAALPGEAEGFRWPTWLSPLAGSFPTTPVGSSPSKRSR